MKRFLVFTVLFPPVALLVFFAPDAFSKRAPTLDSLLSMVGAAYLLAIIPAWLSAAMDGALSAKPAHLRIVATAATGAAITDSIALFLWGFLQATGRS